MVKRCSVNFRRLAVLVTLPLLLSAGTITRTLEFEPRQVSITEANGFDVVQMPEFATTVEPGKPAIPIASFNFVVPANASVKAIRVIPEESVELPGVYRVHPAQRPVPISAKTQPEFVRPDPEVYSGSSPYPTTIYEWNRSTGTMMGWRVCGFGVYPLQWNPATGKLTLFRRLTVYVDYEENTITPVTLTSRQIQAFAPAVASIVVNPEAVKRFAPPQRLSDNLDCDYAIITSSGLASNFQTFAEWRTKKGYYTRIFKTDSISTVYPGRDRQEKIRNFIIDYWQNHGLIYVLLAGDNSIVPARRCRVTVGSTTGNIPADIYYGDLQWSWDGNRNNLFGEMSGDTVDLFYDLFIGRASVENATEVGAFVNKTLYYEKTPTTDYLQKMLLPYVQLWTGYSGRIVSDTIAAKTPASWVDRYIANPTTTTPMRDSINAGFHFCHVAAHGDAYGFYTQGGTAIYTTSVARSQTNSTRPVILNSIACISGNFEASDCLAEELINNPNGGAVATIMNSRYGWGTPPQMGPSEKLDCIFYDYYFIGDTAEIGRNHGSSKGVYRYIAQNEPVWRWCYYALNLFGDPALPMWNGVPGMMSAQNQDTTTTGAQSFQVTVTSGGNPVVGARVCLYKSGELHEVGNTDGSGIARITINPLTPGTMFLTITHNRFLPLEKTVTVIPGAPQPYLAIQGTYVDDGANHQLDPGETTHLYVTLKNLGNAGANNVAALLRTSSSYITLLDSTSSYGSLNPGDTARGDHYRLSASASTPPGTQISFNLHITSTEGSWDQSFTLTVGTPPPPGAVTLDHDTGYCRLSVTALGSIGFTEPPEGDLGAGFSYPKNAVSSLYYASFLLGNSANYIVDRFYGCPSTNYNTDFRIVDSLRAVMPPQAGAEHFRTVFSDAGHTSPKNIRVVQNSYMDARSGYDDFVVLVYDIENQGSTQVDGLYAGVIADFDIGSNPRANIATSNETKRFSFMRSSSSANPCVGVKILAPPSFANLCAIDHARYVYPDSAMTEGMKLRILNGTINQRNSNRAYDWSVGVSVGPFNLSPGGSYRVAFAFVGGASEANFEVNADSAQNWFDLNVGIADKQETPKVRGIPGIVCIPNPFAHTVTINYHLTRAGRVQAEVFDISGRTVGTLLDQVMEPGEINLNWDASQMASGVYILRFDTPEGTETQKLIVKR